MIVLLKHHKMMSIIGTKTMLIIKNTIKLIIIMTENN